MMTVTGRWFLLCMSVALLAGSVAAQEGGADVSGQGAGAGTELPSASSAPAGSANAPARDTALPFSFLTYGASVSEGDGFPRENHAQFGGTFTVVRPQIVFDVAMRRFSIIFESSPALTYYSAHGTALSANGFLDPTFRVTVKLSRRWTWFSGARVDYGADASRFFSSQASSCGNADCAVQRQAVEEGQGHGDEHFATGSVSAAELPESPEPSRLASYSLSQNSFSSDFVTGANWQRTRRQQLALTVSNAYASGEAVGTSPFSGTWGEVASAQLRLDQSVTSRSVVTGYSQVHRYYASSYECSSYGAGMGITQRVGRETVFLEGGPEYGSHGCGQRLGLSYAGTLVRAMTSLRTSVFVSAARDLSAAYLRGNRWADTVRGGFHWETSPRTAVSLGGGYLHSTGQFTPAVAYSGYLVSPEVLWQAMPRLELIASYRYFQGSYAHTANAIPEFSHNWILLTLSWHSRYIKF